MASHTVCLVLLLLSRPCWTSTVRRVGCMVQIGSETAVVKESLGGLKGLGVQTPMPTGTGRPSQLLLLLAKKTEPFHTAAEDSESMTVQSCVLRCWKIRYTFAALQDGSRCLCANTLEGLVPVDRWLCHERCSGNCKQQCGGRVAISVYNTGLLGCYQKAPWMHWCDSTSPSSVVVTFDKQQARQLGDSVPPTSQMIVNVHKPPLVSARMSALMCASYCVSQPQPNPVAVLQAQDTCCCGERLGSTNSVQFGSSKVDFAQNCIDPCADSASTPLCVGTAGDKRYISVYNTFAIWPEESTRPESWNPNASWLQPEFPAHDNFEVSSFRPRWRPQEQEELSGVNILGPDQPASPPAPIVDSANMAPWVFVLDDPEEGGNDAALAWTLSAILLFCFILFLAILIILTKRKKKHPEIEITTTPWREGSKQDQENAQITDITTGMEKNELRKDFTGNNHYYNNTDQSADNVDGNEADRSESEATCNDSEATCNDSETDNLL